MTSGEGRAVDPVVAVAFKRIGETLPFSYVLARGRTLLFVADCHDPFCLRSCCDVIYLFTESLRQAKVVFEFKKMCARRLFMAYRHSLSRGR